MMILCGIFSTLLSIAVLAAFGFITIPEWMYVVSIFGACFSALVMIVIEDRRLEKEKYLNETINMIKSELFDAMEKFEEIDNKFI